jgi:LmbE family N-acetylglucosaminyl deacetylase
MFDTTDPSRVVLVLCPHTDDEFGCAGSIVRLVQSGAEVHYVALSRCEESVPPGYPLDVLERECRECTARLGIPPDNVHVERFAVRHFPSRRQDILEFLVSLKNRIKPTMVLMPSSHDTHQDHHVVFEEGFRAFKHVTLLGYELPQNLISFNNSAFVRLTPDLLDAKINALRAYVSQEFRNYASEEFIRGLATVRGAQCNAMYAEAFEMIRYIG